MAGSESLLAEFIDGVLAKQDAVRLDLSALAPCIKYRSYPAKSTLLSAGQRWDRLFFIRKGLVRLYYLDAQGKESNKAFFAEGDTLWPVAPRDRAEPVRFNIAMLLIHCANRQRYIWVLLAALVSIPGVGPHKFLLEPDALQLSPVILSGTLFILLLARYGLWVGRDRQDMQAPDSAR